MSLAVPALRRSISVIRSLLCTSRRKRTADKVEEKCCFIYLFIYFVHAYSVRDDKAGGASCLKFQADDEFGVGRT